MSHSLFYTDVKLLTEYRGGSGFWSWGAKLAHFSHFFRIFGVCCRFFGASSSKVAFGSDLFRFSVDFWPIFGGFGTDFWTIFRLTLENCDFMKNRVSPWKNQYFLKFGVPKTYKKSTKNR